MRYVRTFLAWVACAAGLGFAEQSADFQWQATQGMASSGSVRMVKEKITITVQPDHLDVEHEMELVTQVSWGEPEFRHSLEILGNLFMEKKAVFTGLLLWNGEKILKGKLQTREMARRKYEEVVERNVKNPPPPRDPAILEKVSENEYRLSIFPVSLNGFRRIRLRYLIPSQLSEGQQSMPFPNAFSGIASVTVRGGVGLNGYAIVSKNAENQTRSVKTEDGVTAPITLDPVAFNQFQPWFFISRDAFSIRHITPLFGTSKGSRLVMGSEEIGLGNGWSNGFAAHLIFQIPSEIADLPSQSRTQILAKIRTETDSIQKELVIDSTRPGIIEELRVFSRSAFKKEIVWQAYSEDKLITEVIETPTTATVQDGLQFFRTFGNLPFYPMVKSLPTALAPAWGFIDARYALLALEQDTLPSALASEYAKAGVPGLNATDIFKEDGDLDSLPISAWLMQKNIVLEDLLKPVSVRVLAGLPKGIRWSFQDGSIHIHVDASMRAGDIRIHLYGMDGKKLKQWVAGDLHSGSVHWNPKANGYAQGQALLRIAAGANVWSLRVSLR
jgi:hypothetical protein